MVDELDFVSFSSRVAFGVARGIFHYAGIGIRKLKIIQHTLELEGGRLTALFQHRRGGYLSRLDLQA